jgi:hypothetical protein
MSWGENKRRVFIHVSSIEIDGISTDRTWSQVQQVLLTPRDLTYDEVTQILSAAVEKAKEYVNVPEVTE